MNWRMLVILVAGLRKTKHGVNIKRTFADAGAGEEEVVVVMLAVVVFLLMGTFE